MSKAAALSKRSVDKRLNDMIRAADARARLQESLYGKRAFSLNPNQGQRIKLARYSVGLTCDLTIAEPKDLHVRMEPCVQHRTRRVVMNAPCPNFVWIHSLQAANVAATVGGLEDAWAYKPESRVIVDWPTITAANAYMFFGEYTGASPSPFQPKMPFRFGISLIGPAHLCDPGNIKDTDLPPPLKAELGTPRKRKSR